MTQLWRLIRRLIISNTIPTGLLLLSVLTIKDIVWGLNQGRSMDRFLEQTSDDKQPAIGASSATDAALKSKTFEMKTQ